MKTLTKDTFAHAIPQRADGANYFAFYSSSWDAARWDGDGGALTSIEEFGPTFA